MPNVSSKSFTFTMRTVLFFSGFSFQSAFRNNVNAFLTSFFTSSAADV